MDIATTVNVGMVIAGFKALDWAYEKYRHVKTDEHAEREARKEEVHEGVVLALMNGAGDVVRRLMKEALSDHEKVEAQGLKEALNDVKADNHACSKTVTEQLARHDERLQAVEKKLGKRRVK